MKWCAVSGMHTRGCWPSLRSAIQVNSKDFHHPLVTVPLFKIKTHIDLFSFVFDTYNNDNNDIIWAGQFVSWVGRCKWAGNKTIKTRALFWGPMAWVFFIVRAHCPHLFTSMADALKNITVVPSPDVDQSTHLILFPLPVLQRCPICE